MSRKSFDVEEFRQYVNDLLFKTICSPEHRRGFIRILENVLHSTGNYKGFYYLSKDEISIGQLPGINISPIDGQNLIDLVERFKNTDDTRVHYF
jgi:hypothetical protein